MQITSELDRGLLELRIQGRLDNEGAGAFLAAVDEALRKGQHAVAVDLHEVSYISSAGLGALIKSQKKFDAIQGLFGVVRASPPVAEALRLTALAAMLVRDPQELRAKAAGGATTVQPAYRLEAAAGLEFAVYDLTPAGRLHARVWGDAGPNAGTAPVGATTREAPFPADFCGLGIGAFGRDDADCVDRLGELVAVAGGVAVQPTPEGRKPDYQVASAGFVPRPRLLHGLSFTGEFSHMIRFECQAEGGRAALSLLVEQCLKLTGADVAGLALVAEAAGLIGARLRRSPVAGQGWSEASWRHPEIRRWFSFSAERAFPHSLVVAAGAASRGTPTGPAAALAPQLRPLGPGTDVQGHFHAAVFSYQPLKKRRLHLEETVPQLFENAELQGVLHLLHDDRAISGRGESELLSGACWIGPLAEVSGEDAP